MMGELYRRLVVEGPSLIAYSQYYRLVRETVKQMEVDARTMSPQDFIDTWFGDDEK